MRGFTIIELMVTVLILAVLLVIAAPMYREFVLDSRMNSEANEFLTSLNFARSEAVKRNARVSMCKSDSGTGCVTSGNWAQGWIVFVDSGETGKVDPSDVVLRVHAALHPESALAGTTADSATAIDYVSYLSDGRSQLVTNEAGKFDLCTTGGSAKGRSIGLALGRATLTTIETC